MCCPLLTRSSNSERTNMPTLIQYDRKPLRMIVRVALFEFRSLLDLVFLPGECDGRGPW